METLKVNFKETVNKEAEVKLPYYSTDGKNKYAKIVSEDRAIIITISKYFTSIGDSWKPEDAMFENGKESNKEEFEIALEEAVHRIKNSII